MSTLSPQADGSLRQAFKRFNPFMLLMWRLGLAKFVNFWPDVGGRIMVIAHTGRKTRQRRYTPANYALVGGDLYCTAGFGAISDWYRNIRADPNVEVWLPDGWWAGVAEDVSGCEHRIRLMRQVLIGSGAVAPLMGVDPHTLSDAQLAAATDGYHLIRIRRTQARTGPGGPGDLAWVWPLATMILLPLALRPRRRR